MIKDELKTFCQCEIEKYEGAYEREFLHPPYEIIDTGWLSGYIVAYENVLNFIENGSVKMSKEVEDKLKKLGVAPPVQPKLAVDQLAALDVNDTQDKLIKITESVQALATRVERVEDYMINTALGEDEKDKILDDIQNGRLVIKMGKR